MADLGLWTGLNQGVQNLTATGMKLFEMNQNRQHQERVEAMQQAQLKMAQDAAVTNQASARLDLEKKQKEAEFLKSGWEPSIDPAIKALPEQEQKNFVTMIDGMNIPKTQEGRQQAGKILASNQELYKQYTAALFQKKLEDYSTVEAEYNSAMEKGDPEKIAAIKTKYEAASQSVHRARGDIDRGIKTVAMNETWNALPAEVKSIPILQTAYKIGVRTGDTSQFDKAMLELTKETSAAGVRAKTEAALNRRAGAANATRIQAANIAANKEAKPSRVPFRDMADGSIKYYDKNNAADRKVLEQYGNQLVPLAENPVDALVMQSTYGKGKTTPKTYKTADEVKAAFKAGTISESDALSILRKDFGMK